MRQVQVMCGGANMAIKVSELGQEEAICLEEQFI